MLRYEGSGTNAGFLLSQGLSRLVREKSVTFTASLGAPKGRQSTSSKDVNSYIRVRPLRVVVYGFLSDKDTVTNILDKDNLFLQRPEESEYDRTVRYVNPMYFTRPGEEIPRMPNPLAVASLRDKSAAFDEEQLGEASGANVSLASEKVKQSSRIISTLKEHQLIALATMIEREQGALDGNSKYPSLWQPSIEGGNQEMGLGKTLSTLALICHHLDRISNAATPQTSRMSRATLIVTPKSTIYGWQQQITRHIRPGELKSLVYHGHKRQDSAAELHNNDIVFTTYDTLRSDWAIYGPLYACSWTRIVLDEAHKIRNRSSQIFQATCEIPAHYRWCLTGTPIQNSLDDFGSLLAFIRVPPFVTRDQFKFWISSPILSNREHSLHTLRKLVCATCLRRTKAHPYLASTPKLPRKTEYVEIVELLPQEREFYEFFKRRSYLLASNDAVPDPKATSKATNKRRKLDASGSISGKQRRKSTGNIMILISVLRMICDHGQALLPRVALEAWQNHNENRVQQADLTEFSCKKHVACETCLKPADGAALACPVCSTGRLTSPLPGLGRGIGSPQAPSSKVSALLRNIAAIHENKDPKDETQSPAKSVIFSYWTGMLDMISCALDPRLSSLNLSAVRIDGRSTLQQRDDALNRFNCDRRCVVMLVTIGAGGEGMDLTVAPDVHIVEPQWNPMAEAQAVDRVHRIGQTKDVTVTRYCVKDSIEEVSTPTPCAGILVAITSRLIFSNNTFTEQ
ncbi:hypothetical protein M406DRAFT_269047 [Cryphonectria parasitica EP155]|uniref:Uncharacterized protein n=1 Tax=Cryphonectria parasitica (strain ATCC 38755 / EP155) TaxID=660469 RepID=A0A9P4XTD7_CRYP1|nr:uncharacterized protein M406DRAFT_269047 [Cryphonectria parasitica EP155]KAF3760335.1 hypothetical protein M406DRAFT_269047 [Cryphonectria parasitica EP155]